MCIRSLACGVMLVALSWHPAAAREIAGVTLAPRVTLPGLDAPLQLNGAGVRRKFFVKVYVAALYLPQPAREASAVLAAARSNSVRMHFVHDGVTRDKLAAAWRSGFAANTAADQLGGLEARLAEFIACFADMRTGDEVSLDYAPGSGTRVGINGTPCTTIPGADFNRALLAVWLGPEPVTPDLKRGLLGLD